MNLLKEFLLLKHVPQTRRGTRKLEPNCAEIFYRCQHQILLYNNTLLVESSEYRKRFRASNIGRILDHSQKSRIGDKIIGTALRQSQGILQFRASAPEHLLEKCELVFFGRCFIAEIEKHGLP